MDFDWIAERWSFEEFAREPLGWMRVMTNVEGNCVLFSGSWNAPAVNSRINIGS